MRSRRCPRRWRNRIFCTPDAERTTSRSARCSRRRRAPRVGRATDSARTISTMCRRRVRLSRASPRFRHQRGEPVTLGTMCPAVVALPRDPKSPTRGRNAMDSRVVEHADAAVVDDLVHGHGGGLQFFARNQRVHHRDPSHGDGCYLNPWTRSSSALVQPPARSLGLLTAERRPITSLASRGGQRERVGGSQVCVRRDCIKFSESIADSSTSY